jgi:phage baseplate assembly protein W
MDIDFPFSIDAQGRAATTDDDDHIRDMIEQVLFTTPGERVNRPDFGSGLLQLVFAASGPELATALQLTIQAALQRWLGDVLDLTAVDVAAEDSAVVVSVEYVVRRSDTADQATFVRRV